MAAFWIPLKKSDRNLANYLYTIYTNIYNMGSKGNRGNARKKGNQDWIQEQGEQQKGNRLQR